MNSDFDLDALKRELDDLNRTRVQEQLNVDVETLELKQMYKSIGVITDLNHGVQRAINDELYQVMGLANPNIPAQVLKNLTQIETELAKLEIARGEQREATDKLNKELKETFDVLVDVQNVDRYKDVKNKIEALEALALEREAEVQRLKVEKEFVQEEIARFRKESSQEIDMLLKQYNELHAEMMKEKKKNAAAEYPDYDNDE